MWNRSLKPELQLSDAGLERTAEQTEGFSFAYLKELFVSAVTGWINETGPGAMDRLIGDQSPRCGARCSPPNRPAPPAATKETTTPATTTVVEDEAAGPPLPAST
jgi:hypothetical protein